MDDATILAYKKEFFDFALQYKELANVPFTEAVVPDQKIFGVKLVSTDYLGRTGPDGTFIVRDEVLDILKGYGYTPEDSIIVTMSYGYEDGTKTPVYHNTYSAFIEQDTAAATYLKDKVTEIINSGASEAALSAVIDEWLLIPLLTTKHINSKNVFIEIPILADESYYTNVIKI